MERSIAGGDFEERCDNCKRVSTELQWIGYLYYCPDCWRAYWDGQDGALKALRNHWIESYIDFDTYWAEVSHDTSKDRRVIDPTDWHLH